MSEPLRVPYKLYDLYGPHTLDRLYELDGLDGLYRLYELFSK